MYKVLHFIFLALGFIFSLYVGFLIRNAGIGAALIWPFSIGGLSLFFLISTATLHYLEEKYHGKERFILISGFFGLGIMISFLFLPSIIFKTYYL